MKNRLDIDNCIILSDVEKIKNEESEKKIKTKNQLAKKIFNLNLVDGATESAIYTRLWRFEKEGYNEEPVELIKAVMQVLGVSRDDLIKVV